MPAMDQRLTAASRTPKTRFGCWRKRPVRPGGLILMQGYRPDQAGYGTGGSSSIQGHAESSAPFLERSFHLRGHTSRDCIQQLYSIIVKRIHEYLASRASLNDLSTMHYQYSITYI